MGDLRRAEERFEAAVKERERAVRHLELARRGELVVECSGARELDLLELSQPADETLDEAVELRVDEAL